MAARCVEPAAHTPHDGCPGAQWVRQAWPDGTRDQWVLAAPRGPSMWRLVLMAGIVLMLTAAIVGAAAWVGIALERASRPAAAWHPSPGPGLSQTPERVRAVQQRTRP